MDKHVNAVGPAGPTPPGVWTPTPDYVAASRLGALCRELGVGGRAALDLRARQDPAAFWEAIANWLGLVWQAQPSAVVDQLVRPEATRWYVDGALNVYDNAVTRWLAQGRGDELALAWDDEAGHEGRFTFTELGEAVERVAAGLAAVGVHAGQRVGVQLPMRVEAALVALALAKLGAIQVPIFSGFGGRAVAARLQRSGATVLVVADAVVRRGRALPLREQTAAALDEARMVSTCITVPVPGVTPQGPPLRGEVRWPEVATARAGVPTAVCGTDHPLMIAFTSGTTGEPKGVTLGHAGFAVKAGSDAALCFDLRSGDVVTWVTDPGWIMSPITLFGGLVAGSAVALVDGAVDFPDAQRLWRSVDALGVTVLGVSPTLVRSLMAAQSEPVSGLDGLRVLASSGEPWTADAYGWLFSAVGRSRLPIINYSGGTEVSGGILTNTVTEPIVPGGFAGPIPGMGADLVDENGACLAEGVGELALRLPSPGMPLGFWDDPGRYERTYWADWPGTWRHGDWVEVHSGGQWYVHGRSDDTLKIAGKRLGPAEVENVVNLHDAVVESAAVGVPDPVKGEALVVFARLSDGPAGHGCEQVRHDIEAAVVADLGKPLKPAAVHFVDDLPRTRSGKILRRLIRDVHLGRDPQVPGSLDNPSALDALRRPW